MKIKFSSIIVALAMMLGFSVAMGFMSPANAKTVPTHTTASAPAASSQDNADQTSSTEQTCTDSTDDHGNAVQTCTILGTDQFHVNEKFVDRAHVRLAGQGDVYLTVQVHPMTPSQIVGQCRTAKVGTPFDNEMVDPATGKHYFAPWHVQAGDNVFCFGHDHQWHKKSCGNIAKGLFGTPRAPKAQRVTGRVQIVDYATWKAHLELLAKKHIGGSITVKSQDGTCEAHASLDNYVRAAIWMDLTVKARSFTAASSIASSSIIQQAHSSQKVKGTLEAKIKILIDAKISAMCTNAPPQNSAPSISAQAGACVQPGQTTGVISGSVNNPNQEAHPTTVASGNKTVSLGSVGAQSSAAFQLSGFAPGQYDVTATFTDIDLSTTIKVTVQQCEAPPATKPSVSATRLNDVEVDQYSENWNIQYSLPNNHTGTVQIMIDYGSAELNSTVVSAVSVTGTGTLTLRYHAPSEVPPGQYDHVKVLLTDTVTGLQSDPDTQSLLIKPKTIHPGVANGSRYIA